MALSANRTAVRSADSIVVDAYQLAALWSASWSAGTPIYQDRLSYGRRLLTDILDEFSTAGATTKFGYFYNQTLQADVENYTLPAYVIDTIGDAKYIGAGETVARASSELTVQQITREEYQMLESKNQDGDPTKFYADKSGTSVVAKLWPIPEEAGTVRFLVQRSPTRADSGDVEIELQSHWHSALRFRLAYELALSNGLPMTGQLRGESVRLETRARAASNQHVATYLRMEHPTPGSWR